MSGISIYQENAVLTQSKGRLVVMLYEGAVKFLRKAMSAMQAENHEEKAKNLNSAIAIIEELNVTLDMEHGGQIAKNLRSLYMFMIRHLHQAITRKEPAMVREVITLLEDLNNGWKSVTE